MNGGYRAGMARIVIPTLGLVTAVLAAVLLGSIAHNELGITSDTIRTDALTSAGFICVAVACGTLLKRDR